MSYKLIRYASDHKIAHIGASCSYTKGTYIKRHLTVISTTDSLEITSTDSGEQGRLDYLKVNLTFYAVTDTGEKKSVLEVKKMLPAIEPGAVNVQNKWLLYFTTPLILIEPVLFRVLSL